MNSEFTNDIKKIIKSSDTGGELAPGSVDRRYEPVGGINKHNAKIHSDSAYADKYKNLPFSFSKPKKSKPTYLKICANCGAYVNVTKNTVGIICTKCKTYSKVLEVDIESGKER